MNNPKEIAETVLNEENAPPDIQTLARAYLDIKERNVLLLKENTLLILDSIEPKTDKDVIIVGIKKELAKLKEENERLNSYVILGYETVHKESLEEITRLIEENLKLEEQNKLADEVISNHSADIDSLRKSVAYLRSENIRIMDELIHEKSSKEKALNNLSASIHKTNVEAGWWTDLATGEPLNRNVGELLCLVHSEISEALEAYRKDLNDDKLPHRKGFEVELADALIRIFDIAGKFMLDLDGAIEEKMTYNAKRADHKKENRQGKNGKKF